MFGGLFGSDTNLPEGWKELTETDQLNAILTDSNLKTQVIFKHSTRCSISSMAFQRLKAGWANQNQENVDFYYLDLLQYRSVSNAIESEFKVTHQSPQIIVVNNQEVTHHASHNAVSIP
jgi:bacillithiol system protein YtxJ